MNQEKHILTDKIEWRFDYLDINTPDTAFKLCRMFFLIAADKY